MADIGGINVAHLRSFVERIERLEEEIKALNDDKKEVYAEAKGTGFDTKIIKQIIKIRRMDKDALDEAETLLDVYKRALGMLPDFGTERATRAGAQDDVVIRDEWSEVHGKKTRLTVSVSPEIAEILAR